MVGLAVARALAWRGATCVVLEKGHLARAATAAAGGMLSPLGEARSPGAFLTLALASMAGYPEFVAGLEGGAEAVGFRVCGKLLVAFEPQGVEALRRRAAWQNEAGFPASVLDGAEARRLEPGLAPDVAAGLHLPTDGVVDNRRLAAALVRSARAAGVTFREGTEVAGLHVRTGTARGVVLGDGSVVEGDVMILAAGAWSGGIAGLPRPLPVRPVRGQMLALAPEKQGLAGVVAAPGAYLIPREAEAGAWVVVGATQEEAGFREGNDPDAVAALHRAAVRAAPWLAPAPIAERWWGFRPGTPDGLPVLGADPELPGLVYATGHFRNGILLAPATAHHLARLVVDGDGRALEPFRPDRFGG